MTSSLVTQLLEQFPVLSGQVLSPLLALSALFSTLLAKNHNFSYPCLQNVCVYLSLLFLYAIYPFLKSYFTNANCTSNLHSTDITGPTSTSLPEPSVVDTTTATSEAKRIAVSRRKKLAAFVVVAFLDVNANVLVVLAFRYTRLTSVMLLDCFVIPCAMFLSMFLLGSRYSVWHIVGVLVCVAGLVAVVVSDAQSDTTTAQQNAEKLKGDLLVLVSAAGYAVSNVLQEFFVKSASRTEFLGMLGLFGSVICIAEAFLLEDVQAAVGASPELYALLGLYVAVIVAYYVLVSLFLQFNDAAFLNISLLSSDFYGMLLGYLVFHQTQQVSQPGFGIYAVKRKRLDWRHNTFWWIIL